MIYQASKGDTKGCLYPIRILFVGYGSETDLLCGIFKELNDGLNRHGYQGTLAWSPTSHASDADGHTYIDRPNFWQLKAHLLTTLVFWYRYVLLGCLDPEPQGKKPRPDARSEQSEAWLLQIFDQPLDAVCA